MGKTLWDMEIEHDTHAFDVFSAEQADLFTPTTQSPTAARQALYERFKTRISHNPALDRTLVSFQANKKQPIFNWFAYREGFSAALVRYLLGKLHPQPGVLLDPFAGAGSALFAASASGWEALGVEVLPVGVYAMRGRAIAGRIDVSEFAEAIKRLDGVDFAAYYDGAYSLHHIAITRGAFPPEEERQLVGFIGYCQHVIRDEDVRALMLFAGFCILEEISFTRKDGQYLRWDARSGRSQGKRPFHKGPLSPFRAALMAKVRQIAHDLGAGTAQRSLFGCESEAEAFSLTAHTPTVHEGS